MPSVSGAGRRRRRGRAASAGRSGRQRRGRGASLPAMRWAGLRVKRVDELLAAAADERFLLRRALGPLNVTLAGRRRDRRRRHLRHHGHGGGGRRVPPRRRAVVDPVVPHHRGRLRVRGALLRRARVDGAGLRVGLHLRLRHARRARRLDHRLGPDHRVRGRERRGGDQLGELLSDAAREPRHRRAALARDRLPHGGAHPGTRRARAARARRADRLQRPRPRHRRGGDRGPGVGHPGVGGGRTR